MSSIIDRRLNSKKKSAVNRKRFLKRYRKEIEATVKDAINKRSVKDIDKGENIRIPANDISEPVFSHGPGGSRSIVHPGNKEFVKGDRIPRPSGGGGSGSGAGDAANSGEGMDEFVFQLTQSEFLEYVFEDLELPNLVKRHLQGNDSFKYVRAGYSSEGNPAKLSIVKTMCNSKARRVAMSGRTRRELKQKREELGSMQAERNELAKRRLEIEIKALEKRLARVPFLDTNDLRYNLHLKQPVPTSRAVMFCLMDVSGSMDQRIKELAKRFYILLYLFLQRNYEKTEVVFIRHHTTAKEVDEQEFFYSRESGGTVVSSAIKLACDIAEQRYPAKDWNIYVAQASDGDNWGDDSPLCVDLLEQRLLPLVQHYSYVEITRGSHQALWRAYEKLAQERPDQFALQQIVDQSDIYPVFRELFARKIQV
ncbi:MAG: YeaH/YhbH family protein [Pseudomonadales bacterium]|nr:YeaH/YhbH family protein [Pseudomonadales bacterium]